MLYRYKISVEYQGTGLVGWQKQNNGISVQGLLEKAIYNFSGCNTKIIGSGRTDAGVHAVCNVAHFDLEKFFDPQVVVRATNHFLKPFVVGVTSCKIVDHSFHARYSAKKRYYLYRIVNRESEIILDKNRAWWVAQSLDTGRMQEAAGLLIGRHDFSSFRASGCQAKSPIITIEQIDITQNHEEIKIIISARSFLYHIVRNITGALVEVGLGRLSAGELKNILQLKDRTKAPKTAPAEGLYLLRVDY